MMLLSEASVQAPPAPASPPPANIRARRLRTRRQASMDLRGTSVAGKDDLPGHQATFFALLESGSAMPCLMDSRMPGTERRCSVS